MDRPTQHRRGGRHHWRPRRRGRGRRPGDRRHMHVVVHYLLRRHRWIGPEHLHGGYRPLAAQTRPSVGIRAAGPAAATFGSLPRAGGVGRQAKRRRRLFLVTGPTGYRAYNGGGPGRWSDYLASIATPDGSIWMAVEFIPGPHTALTN